MSVLLSAHATRINQGALTSLTRTLSSPVGRDLERRAERVKERMKANASGRPGPNIRSQNLYDSIAVFSKGTDGEGLFFKIGTTPGQTIRRGFNYALILEGLFPRGGAPPAGDFPFIARSLDAAR